jgi:putative modified peptide
MQLSKEQSLSLMQKFASDDAFRSQFEKDPATALLGAGLSKEQVGALDAKCLAAGTLADKSAFESLAATPEGEEFRTAMAFHILHLKIGR